MVSFVPEIDLYTFCQQNFITFKAHFSLVYYDSQCVPCKQVIRVFSDILVAFSILIFATNIRVTPITKMQNFLLLSQNGYFYQKY